MHLSWIQININNYMYSSMITMILNPNLLRVHWFDQFPQMKIYLSEFVATSRVFGTRTIFHRFTISQHVEKIRPNWKKKNYKNWCAIVQGKRWNAPNSHYWRENKLASQNFLSLFLSIFDIKVRRSFFFFFLLNFVLICLFVVSSVRRPGGGTIGMHA